MGLIRFIKKIFGDVKIVKGVVIQVNDTTYGGQTTQEIIIGGKIETVGMNVPESDVYSIRVKGVDKNGKEVTEDITVDELTYNSIQVGDAWPQK